MKKTIYLALLYLSSFGYLFSQSDLADHSSHTHELVDQSHTWSDGDISKIKGVKGARGLDLIVQCVPFSSFQNLEEKDANNLLKYAEGLDSMDSTELIELPLLCWEDHSDPSVVKVFEDVRDLAVTEASQDPNIPQRIFQGRNRWTRTATNFSGNTQGTPVTITWGIVPDGTASRVLSGSATLPSNLIATLNATFGAAPLGSNPISDAPWFSMFQSAFDEWSEITGNIYIYEPADDGRSMVASGTSGVLGVRADVRIAANDFGDGPSNVLAFNFFPNNGDMVIDSAGFNTNGPLRNALTFRNTIAHEHGHGLGLAHVCPVNRTKLMEPSVTRNFSGPQLDDVITIQELYGDQLERQGGNRNNNTISTARNLGVLDSGFSANDISISDSNDIDYIRFQVNAPRGLNLTVSPDDSPAFVEGAQPPSNVNGGRCPVASITTSPLPAGFVIYDPQVRQDLRLRLLGPDGVTVIARSNSGLIGDAESLNNVQLTQVGVDYYIEITGGGENSASGNNAQLFDLNLELIDPSAIQLRDFTIVQESCSPANGAPDPDEIVTAEITVENVGTSNAAGVTVSLLDGSDLTVAGDSSQSIGVLAPGGTTTVSFSFAIAGECFDSKTIVFRADTATGFAQLSQDLTLGTIEDVLNENFDASTALPNGFSQSSVSASANWRVATASASSSPNTAFSPGAKSVPGSFLNPNSAFLISPVFQDITDASLLSFDHSYSLVATSVGSSADRVNGGVLEISINNGPWIDWLDAGGDFLENSYDSRTILSFSGTPSPINGRRAWLGDSDGFVTTVASFPALASGQNVRVRWRLSTVRTVVSGGGWRVDNVVLRGPVCCQGLALPVLSVAADDGVAREFPTSDTAEFEITSNVITISDVSVAYSLSGDATSGSDFIALAGSATLLSGQNSVSIPVRAIADSVIEGDESLSLTLASSSDYEIGAGSASITIKDLPFDEYRNENFGGASNNIGDNDDFDEDGVENLLEYAFRLNPTVSDTLPFSLNLEDVTPGNSILELIYREDTLLDDVEYIAETSVDLSDGSWVTNGVTLERGATVSGLQEVKASVSVDTGTPRFIRVRVERQSEAP